jgi:hypothetical protein
MVSGKLSGQNVVSGELSGQNSSPRVARTRGALDWCGGHPCHRRATDALTGRAVALYPYRRPLDRQSCGTASPPPSPRRQCHRGMPSSVKGALQDRSSAPFVSRHARPHRVEQKVCHRANVTDLLFAMKKGLLHGQSSRPSAPEQLECEADSLGRGSRYRMERLRHRRALLDGNSRKLRRPTGDIQFSNYQEDGGIGYRQHCADQIAGDVVH